MADRVTRAQLEAKVQTVNSMLGFRDVTYRTVGAIELALAYGGTKVVQITEHHGARELSPDGYGTMKQAATFLDGMLAALRIAKQIGTEPKTLGSLPKGMLDVADPND